MLRAMTRIYALIVLLGLLLGAAGLPAFADDDVDGRVGCGRVTCDVSVGIGGSSPGGSGSGGSQGVGGGSSACVYLGQELPCSSSEGSWHAGRQCYVRQVPHEDVPDLPFTNLPEDRRVLMFCTRPATVLGTPLSSYYWADVAEPVVPDPAVLAQQAVSYMALVPISMGLFPTSVDQDRNALGYVGWNMWMWVDRPSDATWGPITRSASAGGYTVTATAQVDRVEWDMGNGVVVTCGAGTRHPTMAVRNETSPDCGYRYEREGSYTVTATTFWEVRWSGIGATGVILLQRSVSEQVVVAEVQVVNVPVGDG